MHAACSVTLQSASLAPNLPVLQTRTSVLQLLTALQIDLTDESRKQQLRNSGLGKVVMFLSKVSDEIPANRRLAKVHQL